MLRVFLSLLAVRQCVADVTWRAIGCENWSFQGKTMDQMWDNSVAMTTQAQSQIDAIPTRPSFKYTEAQKIAAANAEFMFGVKFTNHVGLNSAGQATMSTARAMYDDVRGGLEGTLAGLDVNNAFLFCGSNGLVKKSIPDYIGGPSPIWHAEIVDESEGDDKKPTEHITLSYITPSSPEPCTEGAEQSYAGKTFTATQVIGDTRTDFVGIILCPNVWENDGLKVFATLDEGYGAEKEAPNQYPYIGHYNSISGTLLHEMVHVVGRVRENKKWEDPGVGFKLATKLAKDSQTTALINPDTYRIFAEMSMSPATRWGMPNA
ncbi:hypothetical protein AK830_g185 [Neonectria ditissima]|uniref:Lysine-specific metallo-endopeptidase domain-containing protein n=1 Tax=Neonectria ditissima TaxID=78410 RepID=A0A0N8H946_9HYPO|nr:hypothetical protein AK830_g185 [Neonectria ditissima]